MNKKKNKWAFVIPVLILSIIFMALVWSYAYFFTMNTTCDTPYERPTNCFSYAELSWECREFKGYMYPIIENGTKYWTCTTLDYKVIAC